MEEVWKDINGYEGLYQVSNCGRIRSLWFGKKKLLKQQTDINGYLYVDLYNKNGKKKHKVHRLVANEFCERTDGYDVVNHKDEDKTNNHYDNLEWCTIAYNNAYGTRNERAGKKKRRKVRCVELDIIFDSTTEAAEYVNAYNSNISACAKGKHHTCKGYHWEYVD